MLLMMRSLAFPAPRPSLLLSPSLPSTLGLTQKVQVIPDLDNPSRTTVRWSSQIGAVRYAIYASPSPLSQFRNKFAEVPREETSVVFERSILLPPEVVFYFWVGVLGPRGDERLISSEPVFVAMDEAFDKNPMSKQTEIRIIKDRGMKFYAEEIRRRHLAIVENDGEEFFLYIRRLFGQPCVCTDAQGQRVLEQSVPSWRNFGKTANPTEPEKFEDAEAQNPSYRGSYRCEECMPPGTQITTSSLLLKPIQDIVVEDGVKSHMGKSRRVTRIFKRAFDGQLVIIMTSRTTLRLTEEHPVWSVRSGRIEGSVMNAASFVPAKDVRVGDRVVSLANGRVRKESRGLGHEIHTVTYVGRETYKGDVFNIEVERDNSYVANGLIAHNCLGTSIAGGYYPKLRVRIRYGEKPPRVFVEKETGIQFTHDFNSHTIWHPRLMDGDVIVRTRTGERFVVRKPQSPEWRGIVTHQEFNAVAQPTTSMIYKISDERIRQALEEEGALNLARFSWSVWA